MKNHIVTFLLSAIFLLIIPGCRDTKNVGAQKKVPIEVKTVTVEKRNIVEYLTFNGVTRYQNKENIRSNVTGFISYLPYSIGDAIRTGSVFATVRTKEQDALRDAVSIDSSLAKFVNPLTIRSNGTGILTVLGVNQNDYIAEGDVLATIAEPRSLVVQVNVPYEYEDFVSVGSSCEIILQNEAAIHAKISGELPSIDPLAQSQPFLVALPDEDLPEGLNVLVKMVYRVADSTLSIPKQALQTNELLTQFWVMKILHDTLAVRQEVRTGIENDSLVQLLGDGLVTGDRVITEGAYQMQDSTLVTTSRK